MNSLPPIQDMGSTVVLSMDVKALYPSVSKQLATRTMVKAVKESNIPWVQVDSHSLSRYVSLIIDRKVIKNQGLDDYIPVPKPRTTLNSYTNPSKEARAVNCDSLFNPPAKDPSDREVRKMLALAVGESVRVTMDNHYYTFGGNIHKQNDGGGEPVWSWSLV